MPSPSRKSGKTRKRLSKSPSSKSPNHRNDKRERELAERAKNDSAVRDQLIELMEEDDELITTFQSHLERQFGDKWNSLNSKQKAVKIKNAMMKHRIPQSNQRGGKRTKRRLRKRGKKQRRTRRK